uniref:ORF311 n=1 Tax=Euplotes crassus TaxID=5936 RepID=D1LDS1_EUPCR|nr:ORF311 [Moneuplotes crassus]
MSLFFFFNTFSFDSLLYAHSFISIIYDSYFFNVANNFIIDFVSYLSWLFVFLFFIFIFFSMLGTGSTGAVTNLNFFLIKFYLFANHFAFENRLQLDWVLFFIFFSVTLWVPLLMTYDDTNVEIIELLHSFICLFFVFIITYLLYRCSIHYFAFLENTVSDGFSTAYLLKQFVRDISNTFALFLRFFLLLFRLNIYDGLDDFLDPYYIFFIDFDEDSYFDELFVSFDFLYYFADNREDVIFYKPTEFEWWGDIFTKFFILFGKFFFFWALILEEIFRVTLALYISYLIIFEVHAVNISFNEERFINIKKAN